MRKPFSPARSPYQLEVTAASSRSGVLVGWVDVAADQNTMDCAFSVTQDGMSWTTPLIHRNPNYNVSLNPTVTSDSTGRLFAMCLSAKSDYSAGVLEVSTSNDRGVSWSPWTEVYSATGGTPDKPWLATAGRTLNVVFTNFKLTGKVEEGIPEQTANAIIMSTKDAGSSWSSPKIFPEINYEKDSKNPKIFGLYGVQGPSITATSSKNCLISWGEYGGPITFSLIKNGTDQFSSPIQVSESDVNVPITQILSDRRGKNIIVLWYNAHNLGPIYISSSHDSGATWSKRRSISSNGTLASALLDEQLRLHIVWTEQDNTTQVEDVKYSSSEDFGKSFSETFSLAGGGYVPTHPLDFGAYQSLSVLGSDKVIVFWMNRAGDGQSRIYQSIISASAEE